MNRLLNCFRPQLLIQLHYLHAPALPVASCSLRFSTSAEDTSTGFQATKAGPCLLVQPRHRKDLDEALQLVEAFTGPPSAVMTVGPSRMTRPGPSYFGKGSVESIRLAAMAEETGHDEDGADDQDDLDESSQQRERGTAGGGAPEGGRYSRARPHEESPLAWDQDRDWDSDKGVGRGASRRRSSSSSSDSRCRVIVNAGLSPLQERNLSFALGREVIDRVNLILGIFANRAQTREAKLQDPCVALGPQGMPCLGSPGNARSLLGAYPVNHQWADRDRTWPDQQGLLHQAPTAAGREVPELQLLGKKKNVVPRGNTHVELASLVHQKARLAGGGARPTGGVKAGFRPGDSEVRVQVVSARQRGSRGASGLGGGGGSGDQELQMQRHRILRRIRSIQQDLKIVRDTRALHRQGRKAAGLATVSVVGYTNVGKSSLTSALSGRPLVAKDALFVTLDPAARRVELPSGEFCIMSDTVGFISDLPTELVEAFKATLEEVVQADIIVHVLDASSPSVLGQRATVLQLLADLGVSPHRLQHGTIEVWNKCDLLGQTAGEELLLEPASATVVPAATPAQPSSVLLGGNWGVPPEADGGAERHTRSLFWVHFWRLMACQRQRQPCRLRRSTTPSSPSHTTHTTSSFSISTSTSTSSNLTSSSSSSLCIGPTPCLVSTLELQVLPSSTASSTSAPPARSCSDGDDEGAEDGESGRVGWPSSGASGQPDQEEVPTAPGDLTRESEEVGPELQQMPSNSSSCSEAAPAAGPEAERGALIMQRLESMVRTVHDSGPYRPVAVATSARAGWGHDTLLQLLELKLRKAGFLRG